jgi:hypothetical protein
MKTSLTRLLGATALTAALSLTPAMAQDDFGEWDLDGDGLLTEEEFLEGWGDDGDFSEWDLDGDGVLTEDEYRIGLEEIDDDRYENDDDDRDEDDDEWDDDAGEPLGNR